MRRPSDIPSPVIGRIGTCEGLRIYLGIVEVPGHFRDRDTLGIVDASSKLTTAPTFTSPRMDSWLSDCTDFAPETDTP